MPSTKSTLITEAKRLQRLQDRRRKLRRELRDVDEELKLVRRNLRGLSAPGAGDDLDGQLPPMFKRGEED